MRALIMSLVASAGTLLGAFAVARRHFGSDVLDGRTVVRHLVSMVTGGGRVSVTVLQRRAYRRILARAMPGVSGSVLLPNLVSIGLDPRDFRSVAPVRSWFTSELIEAVIDEAAARSWRVSGQFRVTVAESTKARPGSPVVSAKSALSTGTTEAEPGRCDVGFASAPTDLATEREASAPASTPCVWRVTGDSGPIIVDRQLRIGRAVTCEIRTDPAHRNISRHHADLLSDGGALLVVDRSRNGIRVNGVPVVRSQRLNVGDVLAVATGVNYRVSRHRDVSEDSATIAYARVTEAGGQPWE